MKSYSNDLKFFRQSNGNREIIFMCKCMFKIGSKLKNGSLFITDDYLFLMREKSKDRYRIPLKDITRLNKIDTYFKTQLAFECGENYQREIKFLSKNDLTTTFEVLLKQPKDELNKLNEIELYEYTTYQTPIYNELLIGDIIALWWFSITKTPDKVPGYFVYRYEINIKERINVLIDKGYLGESNPTIYIQQLTNNELKSILRKHKLKVSGNKKDLTHRLLSELSVKDLEKLPSNNSFMPTKDGYELLKRFSYVIYGHRYLNEYITSISMYDKYQELHSLTKTKYLPGDISWTIYNELENREQLDLLRKNTNSHGKLRNVNLYKYYQLKREKKIKDALVNLLIVLLLDYFTSNREIHIAKFYKEVALLRQEINLSIEELGDLIDDAVKYVSIYAEISNVHEFYKLLTAFLENDKEAIENYSKTINLR